MSTRACTYSYYYIGSDVLSPFDAEREAVLGNQTQQNLEEEEDGEELFGDNFERLVVIVPYITYPWYTNSDYRPLPHLDVYDEGVVDDAEYDTITPDARAAAEREMSRRDRIAGLTQGRMRPDLLYGK